MSVDINEILNSIDKRIEGIVTRPNMWGGPEALELQINSGITFDIRAHNEQRTYHPDRFRKYL